MVRKYWLLNIRTGKQPPNRLLLERSKARTRARILSWLMEENHGRRCRVLRALHKAALSMPGRNIVHQVMFPWMVMARPCQETLLIRYSRIRMRGSPASKQKCRHLKLGSQRAKTAISRSLKKLNRIFLGSSIRYEDRWRKHCHSRVNNYLRPLNPFLSVARGPKTSRETDLTGPHQDRQEVLEANQPWSDWKFGFISWGWSQLCLWLLQRYDDQFVPRDLLVYSSCHHTAESLQLTNRYME